MKFKELMLTSLGVLAIAGCQTMPYQPYARAVKAKPQEGGVIALKLEHRDEDKTKAHEMMSRNCAGAQVKVLEEGEVVIGQETATKGSTSHNAGTSDKQVGSLFGVPLVSSGRAPSDSTNSVASTSAIKEWQLTYTCVSAVSVKSSKKIQ